MNINIKKLRENAVIPARGSANAAGCDLYACLEGTELCIIPPHQTLKVQTGIALAIPEGYFGAIFARSGLATKKGLRPANCVGVVDSDYRGEILVALHNDTDAQQEFQNGERIAQIVVMPYLPIDFTVVTELDETKRGAGGFGSTGTTSFANAQMGYEQCTSFDLPGLQPAT